MIDQYATGIAMKIVLAQQAKRGELLMFSALPDAPVLPSFPPSRTRRVVRRLLSTIKAVRLTPSGGAAHNPADRIERKGCAVHAEHPPSRVPHPPLASADPVRRLPEISRV